MYCIVLYFIVLYCIVLYCIVFFCIILYCIVLCAIDRMWSGFRKLDTCPKYHPCGLTTPETRSLRGDQIEVHNFTLVKKQSGLGVRKFSFSQRTINVWNKLSTECVHATSVNVFKNRIDKYLIKAGYT